MTLPSSSPASGSHRLPLPELLRSEARLLLCYPTCERAEEVARQIQQLGVSEVELTGGVTIGRYRVLGKGFVGLVVKARLTDGRPVAMKIRRGDASRPSMDHEAHLTQLANLQGVGPRLIAYSKDVLLIEFIEGMEVDEYIRQASPEQTRRMARRILEQCWALDRAGISHGELSTLRKHVIVKSGDEDEPVILDFEGASLGRRRSNVTAAGQYLFVSGPSSPTVRRAVEGLSIEEAIEALREYKRGQTEHAFRSLLGRLRLA